MVSKLKGNILIIFSFMHQSCTKNRTLISTEKLTSRCLCCCRLFWKKTQESIPWPGGTLDYMRYNMRKADEISSPWISQTFFSSISSGVMPNFLKNIISKFFPFPSLQLFYKFKFKILTNFDDLNA